MAFLADTVKMRQVSKRCREKRSDFGADGSGLEYCNECPFLKLTEENAICNTSDVILEYGNNNKIPVPDWCGNKKH